MTLESLRRLAETKMAATKLGVRPAAQHPEVKRLLAAIESYQDLESDWEPDKPAAEPATVSMAKALVSELAAQVDAYGLDWKNPLVGAGPDGQIGLTFEGDGVAVLLLVDGCGTIISV